MLFGLSAVVSTQDLEAARVFADCSVEGGGGSTASRSCAVPSRLGGAFDLCAVTSQTCGERFGGGLKTWSKIEDDVSCMARKRPLVGRMEWWSPRHREVTACFCLLRVWGR